MNRLSNLNLILKTADELPTALSGMSRDELELAFADLHECFSEHRSKHRDAVKRAYENAHRWEGKCAILRHENNQLRKKLYPKDHNHGHTKPIPGPTSEPKPATEVDGAAPTD